MSKIAVVVEKHTVTRACKRLIIVVSHPARELIGGHVTRENRIYAREELQHAYSFEDLVERRLAAALRHFVSPF
jgi:hypothetical protein